MTGTETAVLEPERIARMRAGVMGTIEAERTARRSRRRGAIALGGVAAAAVVVIGGAVTAGLNGGLVGGADSMSAGRSAAGDVESAPDAEGDARLSVRETVITTGSMSARVDDVEEATGAIRDFAVARGGRIDGESVEAGANPFADLTVRIAASRVPELRDVVEDHGEVRSMNVNREDVAAQVADVDARIESLETSIRRLRAIIAEASTTKDLLDAEAQLTRRQADLEALQAQRRVLGDQTGLATIHVSLQQTDEAQSVEPGGFVGGLTKGWNALVAATNAVVTAAGVVVPWLLPVGAFAALGLLARRRLGRGSR